MTPSTLFLGWQDKEHRQWFPIGRLDAEVDRRSYRFRYIGGAKRAHNEAGFPPLYEFPDFLRDYRSRELFPLFTNRVIAPTRPDRSEYLRNLNLNDEADPIEILAVNGGQRTTDLYEVFPKIRKRPDGTFTYRFFAHGTRYVPSESNRRINRLVAGERLNLTLELTNPVAPFAVQIQTEDYYMIGWSPRYLVDDLVAAMTESPFYSARVVRVNPQSAPSKQRVLVQMEGKWRNHTPMDGADFQPLVK